MLNLHINHKSDKTLKRRAPYIKLITVYFKYLLERKLAYSFQMFLFKVFSCEKVSRHNLIKKKQKKLKKK